MSMYTYSYSFTDGGPAPWNSWMPTSVLPEGGVRFQAPATLDPNHIDGIGPLWLVAHLSIPALGSPGILDLRDAQIDIRIRASDFNPNGAKLVWWICTQLPSETQDSDILPGLQTTNWAHTGQD